ncbi:hypothetical protein MMC24_000691 [Lignoscripta atroalba]|nr:hypothetical protein [Lignoscripta atroalba]
MGVYRLGCQNKECKANGIKIEKGTLRYGSQYAVEDRQSWSWRHWYTDFAGCVTPRQIQNLKDTIDDNLDYLDGYDEITSDMQAKVRQALEDGHVADEEWRGDVEVNRPGKNGFRSPAPKKSKKDVEAGNEDGNMSPSKPAPKKRSRTKKEDDEEVEPAPKRGKAATKKGKNAGANGEDHGSELEPPKPKKIRTQRKKAADKASMEDMSEQESNPEVNPKQTRASRKAATTTKIKHEVSDLEANGEIVQKASEKSRAQRKAATTKNIKDEGSGVDTNGETTEEAPKKTRAPRKTTVAKKVKDEDADAEVGGEITTKDASRKVKVTRKAATTKKGLEDAEDGADINDDVVGEVAKPQRGRKKVTERATNGRYSRQNGN